MMKGLVPQVRARPLGANLGASADKAKVRHRRTTAHERARYRCFLPDLAGLAGKRRAEPMPDSPYYQEIAENRNGLRFPVVAHFEFVLKGRGFSRAASIEFSFRL